tara:strand:- start:4624 stop:5370 length:747 start_codon:yes stop_codon:yes gene_type:complete
MTTPSKGFVIVASRNQNFYVYAVNLIESIKDWYPEAQICLVTEERFIDERADEADQIIFCTDHYRAKLWGMSQSPYDVTMYVDADMDCEHEDIAKVWDELGDRDLVFHELTPERGKYYAIREFKYNNRMEQFTLCGGVCLYNSANPLVREFMEEWFELFNKQHNNMWQPEGFDHEQFHKDLKHFDQTTLWYMTEKMDKYKDLKVGIFHDDIRWNYFTQYAYEGLHSIEGKPPILRHYSGSLQKDKLIV